MRVHRFLYSWASANVVARARASIYVRSDTNIRSSIQCVHGSFDATPRDATGRGACLRGKGRRIAPAMAITTVYLILVSL